LVFGIVGSALSNFGIKKVCGHLGRRILSVVPVRATSRRGTWFGFDRPNTNAGMWTTRASALAFDLRRPRVTLFLRVRLTVHNPMSQMQVDGVESRPAIDTVRVEQL
jgi:hypothetical protein